MPRFGRSSKMNLLTAHEDLRYLFNEVVEQYDCRIICGHRTRAEQERAFFEGYSTRNWPRSSHNSTPSLAVDVAPWPIDWQDTERFYHFGGFVKGQAVAMGIPIIWGGDWDNDYKLRDQHFFDLVHFELDMEA